MQGAGAGVRVNTKTGRIGPIAAHRRSRDRRRRRLRLGLGARQRLDPRTDRSRHRTHHAAHALPASAAYNIWLGGGSVWVADDQGAQVIRLSRTGVVSERSRSGTARPTWRSQANSAWVINHRDRKLFRIDLTTNTPALVGRFRATRLNGWSCSATASGSPAAAPTCCRSIPATGVVRATIEIGASGIDVALPPVRSGFPTERGRRSPGFPTMQALRRISATTKRVQTVTRRSRARRRDRDRAQGRFVWLADNRAGQLYRFTG